MKYLILVIGRGDGCDYTIGCNLNWCYMEFASNVITEDMKKAICDHVFEEFGDDMIKQIKIIPLVQDPIIMKYSLMKKYKTEDDDEDDEDDEH